MKDARAQVVGPDICGVKIGTFHSYIYQFIYIYIYMYSCIYIYVYTYINMYACVKSANTEHVSRTDAARRCRWLCYTPLSYVWHERDTGLSRWSWSMWTRSVIRPKIIRLKITNSISHSHSSENHELNQVLFVELNQPLMCGIICSTKSMWFVEMRTNLTSHLISIGFI